MSATTPVWVLLATGAVGGAGLTGLVNSLVWWLGVRRTHRHRHDEVRRDRYIGVLEAVDVHMQALVNAVDGHNRWGHMAINASRPEDLSQGEVKAALEHAGDLLAEANRKRDELRGALLTVALFAPESVMRPLNRLSAELVGRHHQFEEHDRHAGPAVLPLPIPSWPDGAGLRFRDAVRADLGLPALSPAFSADRNQDGPGFAPREAVGGPFRRLGRAILRWPPFRRDLLRGPGRRMGDQLGSTAVSSQEHER